MKKFLIALMICLLLCGYAAAESARDYALWLEEALPGAAFTDAEVPGFVTEKLGMDYEFIARTDDTYGGYIAGVRKAGAPSLPDSARQSSFSGTFETRVFRAEDEQGNIYYDFVLADGVYMYAYDGLQHLLIRIDPEADGNIFSAPGSLIFTAADSRRRAELLYGLNCGFSLQNPDRSQMAFPVHCIESWHAGATREPTFFYLDVTPPQDMMGDDYLDEEELLGFTRIPIGVHLQDGAAECEVVISGDGTLGVEMYEPHHRLYEAGPGCEALVNLAEKILGYRPGEPDFLGGNSIRATLEWQGGSICIEEAEKLRRLDEMFGSADFSVGSVNCPSPCFLTLEYADGSSASMAVAINSFDLFFCNGMYFTAGNGELIDLFNLQETNLYKDMFGG